MFKNQFEKKVLNVRLCMGNFSICILGPQQVVLISNTHTDNYFKIKRGQEGVGKKEALFK